jgi:hypothetical protein
MYELGSRIASACSLGAFAAMMVLALACGDDSASPGGGGGGTGGGPVIDVEVAELAVTEPGEPLGAAVEVLIPPEGGTVESDDHRLTVEIPDGALDEATTITVQPITNGCPGALGVAYRLGPDGQTFNAPVKLHYHYQPADLAGSEAVALRVAYHDADGHWNSLKEVELDETTSTLTAETSHFSDWSSYAGWKLSPASATTRADGVVGLQVKVCSAPDPGSSAVTALLYTCAPDPDFFAVQEWSVNGTKGGTAAAGKVGAGTTDGTAIYQAPPAAPASNPVAVSAAMTEVSGRKTVLTSNIWVDAHPPLEGSIASLQVNLSNPQDFYTISATVRFVYSVDNDQYELQSGTFFARHDQTNPGGAACEIHTAVDGEIPPADGTIIIQDGTYYPYGRTSALYIGTSTCNGTGTKPISIMDSALWWPAPQMGNLVVRNDGSLQEQLTGIQAYGLKVNVVWELLPVGPE